MDKENLQGQILGVKVGTEFDKATCMQIFV